MTAAPSLQLWSDLVLARAFDQAMCELNPHWHEARGEEAVIVGGFGDLRSDDVVAPHFRGSCAAALLRGVDPEQVGADVFGTAASTSAGHWRGDICPSPGPTFIGMFSGSLGTTVAYATGAALHLKRSGSSAIAVCSFGDGTANSGIVYESMNMASMYQLPIVYICQNNQYATSLASSIAIAGDDVSARARACAIPAEDVDGNDVEDVRRARDLGVDRARSGGGPSFIQARTYRLGGHYMSDPEVYRTQEEVRAWEARDPLVRYQERLTDRGLVTAEGAQADLAQQRDRMKAVLSGAKDQAVATVLREEPYAEGWRWSA